MSIAPRNPESNRYCFMFCGEDNCECLRRTPFQDMPVQPYQDVLVHAGNVDPPAKNPDDPVVIYVTPTHEWYRQENLGVTHLRSEAHVYRRHEAESLIGSDRGVEIHDVIDLTPQRINEAHTEMTKNACETGAMDHAAQDFKHRPYSQNANEGCYICWLLEENARLEGTVSKLFKLAAK